MNKTQLLIKPMLFSTNIRFVRSGDVHERCEILIFQELKKRFLRDEKWIWRLCLNSFVSFLFQERKERENVLS